ncbi:MAG TPA: hypothetical protein DHW61_07880 [Lachnoclostridium phytofermentans]|uniref:Type II secretion system protein G n=1 Tax=Lachnoclostridium phytofermentans TaxID=66219 RepID=A0A3D2X5A8_9FIRM|nr:hypothetical protein [Lachnoclostridium sp.]HCL02319.1 hypothetical protein [Lachnoclostridium phytofermentans]
MQTWTIVMLVILAILVVLFVALLIYGRKMQKKQEASQADIRAGAQSFSILVIDKKRMRIKDAGFPQIVLDQTPKYLRRSKVPVVKAKIGPKVATLMCEEKVFDLIPIKKEIKAVINGIYILDVKGLRGGLEQRPVKQKFFKKMKSKITKKN